MHSTIPMHQTQKIAPLKGELRCANCWLCLTNSSQMYVIISHSFSEVLTINCVPSWLIYQNSFILWIDHMNEVQYCSVIRASGSMLC